MIVPELKGGLGNQMFQIANAFALAKRVGCDWGINYGLSYCPNQGFTAHKYKDNFYSKIPLTTEKPSQIYREPFFKYAEVPRLDNVLLMGYFQSSKYFEDCENEVNELFEFPKEVTGRVNYFLQQFNKPVVGIHIRRGDYKQPLFANFHGIQNASYYINASKMLQDHQAIICTDDWGTVKREMRFSKAVASPFINALEDLYLLSRCDSLIICNSSFSWWGAFLGKTKDKIIAPRNWFGDAGEKEHDLFRKEWILL